MVQLPDSIRPYAQLVQKFHFWILAALAPLVLLPLLFLAQSGISAEIKSKRSKITSSVSSIDDVLEKRPHPNEKWSEQIGKRAQEINDETLQAWQRLWKAQEPLRQWPEILGKDFVKAAESLTPGETLRRSLRERYQNEIRPVPRQLPIRMGVDDLMGDAAVTVGPPQLEPGRAEATASLAQWNQADQQQLFASFNWDQLPSTTQIVMAQEELWMYGVVCDVIKKVNSSPVATDPQAVITPANIPIPLVQELKVGYLAAEDDPGGQASQRIVRIESTGGIGNGGEQAFVEDSSGSFEGRPAHPRFGGGSGRGMDPSGEPGFEADASPDNALKNWVYVDLDSKPLTAADLDAAPQARILRLMPFLIRATIDQRALDSLLVELASAPVPIDTRQVRINAERSSALQPGGQERSRPREEARGGDRPRLHDVNVELRGTLAIVMPPDLSLLTVGSDDGQGEDAE